ncbi:MAG: hypothetical protein NXI24_05170 [bacterium]|nr:hypothetical protein [bacterium]
MSVDQNTIKTMEELAADISKMAMDLTQEQQNITPEAFDLAMLSSRILGNARELGELLGKLKAGGAK